MKNKTLFFSILTIIAASLLIGSCNSKDDDTEIRLSVSGGDLTLEDKEGVYTVYIQTNSNWKATIDEEAETWLSIKSTYDNSITFSVEANTSDEQRSGNVTILLVDESKSTSFKIIQKSKVIESTFTVNPQILNVPNAGGNFDIEIKNPQNVDWTYEIKGSIDWISEKSRTENSITFTVDPNDGEQRGYIILFKDKKGVARDVSLTLVQMSQNTDDPTKDGYFLQSFMRGSEDLIGKDYKAIHSFMQTLGWDYSEHPNSSDKDHKDGIHCENVYDDVLGQYVFKFTNHINPHLDGDRGSLNDRQRNEMKSRTSSSWYKLNGNWDEWQILEWKFKIPKGFRPSSSFCHIHQLKAQEGNNGAPLITLTPRGSNDGTKRRMQVIHTGDVSATNKGTIVDNIPLEEFEDEWVKVQEEVHYTHNGYYRIKVTRIRDQKVLINYSIENIDMWRTGATNIRNKFGIYRSYGKSMSGPDDRPSNGIKDEDIFIGDFYIYEKNTNPNPQPHD